MITPFLLLFLMVVFIVLARLIRYLLRNRQSDKPLPEDDESW